MSASIKRVAVTGGHGNEVGTGVPYDKTDAPYVQVDEAYPMRGYNVYSLTKVLGEEMARQFCLNDPSLLQRVVTSG
nr:hypothetical protein [Pseudomonas sp. UBA4194]